MCETQHFEILIKIFFSNCWNLAQVLLNLFFLKLKKLRQVLLNSSRTWTRRVLKILDNRPALVITKQKNLQIGKFRKLKKMSPTRSQLDVSKDGKNPNGSPNKTLRWALCLLSPVFCRVVVCSLLLPQASMVRWSSGSAALIQPLRSFSCGARVKFEIFAVLLVIRLLVW
jgi:hypothetical protein